MHRDLLVKLYELPDPAPAVGALREQGIAIRRVLPCEKHLVTDWVRRTFHAAWASECDTAIHRQPVSCFVATEGERLVGFACHEATCRGFFGPAGVVPDRRGRGIGKALLLACLEAMRAMGYAYAVIGAAGPVEFYARAVGAVPIEGSAPGIYRGRLKDEPPA